MFFSSSYTLQSDAVEAATGLFILQMMDEHFVETAISCVVIEEANSSFAKSLIARKKTARKYTDVFRQWQNFQSIKMIYSCRFFLRTSRAVWSKQRRRGWLFYLMVYRDEADWFESFKMGKETFKYICEELRQSLAPLPNPLTKRASVSVEEQVAISIYYMGCCAELRVIAELFGYAKSTVFKCVRRVCKAIVEVLLPVWIRMPTPDECEQQARLFEAKTGLLQIIGAIDGSQIPITAPKVRHSDYINRKGWPSLNLQGFVDYNAL